MRRAVLCLAVLVWSTAAFADGWTARMEEDEGGSVLVASVTAPADGSIIPALRMMCAGDQGVALRYDMAVDAGQPGSAADFLFENESTQAKLHMAYEDMDGAFAAYFPRTDPVVTLLQTGEEVFVSDSSGNFPAQTFALKGSGKAIGALLKTCK